MPADPGPTPLRLAYGEHPSQHGTLTVPTDGPGPWPVAVILHGGFWRTGYGAELGVPLAEDLARHGCATWNLEYRRVGDHPTAGGGGWPMTCLDVAAGVDLLADAGQQTAAGRLDLTRVVVVGHSAGGHLAGWLAGRGSLPADSPGAGPLVRVTGLVAQAGVLDLDLAIAENLGGGATQAFLGPAVADPAARALASPVQLLPTGVRSVCVHGTADDVVGINQSERYVSEAVRGGDDARLVAVPGADHMAPVEVGSTAWAACRAAVLELSR